MPRAYSNTWDRSEYNFYDLYKQRTTKELTREYKRMKAEAERRLGALSRSKNEAAQTMFRQYSDIMSMKKPRSKKATVKEIIAMEEFLSNRRSKVTEIYKDQRKALTTLQDRGYDFITNRNLKDFGKFMELMRQSGYARKGSSGTVMEFLSERGKIGKNAEALKAQFERWLDTVG